MSKVDKIVATFSTTISKLRAEATRLDDVVVKSLDKADALKMKAEDACAESARADAIANNLEGIINV